MITANSHSSAFATSSDSPVSATRPVMPSPSFVRGKLERARRSPRRARRGTRSGRPRRPRRRTRGSCGSRSASRSSSAIASPIWRTSFSRLSLPARLWSIFRCAIERTSRPATDAPSGRSVASSSKRTIWFLPRAFAVIIAASAQATSSRGFIACCGPCAIPIETVILPAGAELDLARALGQARSRAPSASPASQEGMITANSSPPSRQTTSEPRTRPRRSSASVAQHLVAGAVAVDVVDALEVVDVEHQHRDRVVRAARARELGAQALVEVAVVVEAGERVGLRLVLEPRADLRVVERERGRVAEALRELELVVVEGRVLAEAVDVERALDDVAGDQRDRDQRLGLVAGVPGTNFARGSRCAWFVSTGSRWSAAQPVMPSPKCERLSMISSAHWSRASTGVEQPLRLVGLVDRERVVRDQIGERVGDPLEQRVEALLGEDVVEDVREPPVRLDERLRTVGLRAHRGSASRCLRRVGSREQVPHPPQFLVIRRSRRSPGKGNLNKG